MRMKLGVSTLLTLLVVLPAQGAETIEKTVDTAPGQRLEIDIEAGGELTITGWNRSEVEVRVEPGGRDQDNVKVEISAVNSGVLVRSRVIERRRKSSTSFEYEIMVPSEYDISLDSRGGSVTIDGVEGEIGGRTMGGALKLSNLRGQLDLRTMGGGIVLQDSDVDGKVSTMGGNVELRDVVGDVDASTMGGDVQYQNVQRRQGPDAKAVVVSTMGGRIHVPDAPGGADVNTMGGEIEVDRAAGYVKADTMGGAITIHEVDGWVKAETMGGAIDVTMVGNPSQGRRDVELDSAGGDITLTVPDGLSMRFDIEIEVSRRAKRDYSIESDFAIDVSGQNASPQRKVVGTGSTGSGEHTVRIRTTDGDVRIRRGN